MLWENLGNENLLATLLHFNFSMGVVFRWKPAQKTKVKTNLRSRFNVAQLGNTFNIQFHV